MMTCCVWKMLISKVTNKCSGLKNIALRNINIVEYMFKVTYHGNTIMKYSIWACKQVQLVCDVVIATTKQRHGGEYFLFTFSQTQKEVFENISVKFIFFWESCMVGLGLIAGVHISQICTTEVMKMFYDQ